MPHICQGAAKKSAFDSTIGPGDHPTIPGEVSSADIHDPAQELIGKIIGERYEIQRLLGQGGMGVVYQARHISLEKLLAVKLLLIAQNEEYQRRFLQEAQLASQINHPNTVFLSDFGVLPDGRSYIVMELLRGPTLASVIAEGAMEPMRVCKIAAQIAHGLQAVHDQGIIHRDLKPENVFLLEQDGKKDNVKIVDFGIAKATSEAPVVRKRHSQEDISQVTEQKISSQTMPGTLMGTPAYLAPEMALGQEVDFRVDQYALGVILYQMLCGRPPFTSPADGDVGAILGVLLAVHVVMPAIGVKGLVSLGAALDMAVGVALLALARPQWRWRWELPASAGAAALAFAVILLTVHFDPLRMTSGVYRIGVSQSPPGTEVQYYQDGKTASISLNLYPDGVMAITTNGKPDAAIDTRSANGSRDEITMVMAAVLPLSLRPDAKTAAIIGLGSGLTTHNLLGTDRIERVDTVEIEPAVVDGARGFGHFVERAFTDPRSRIHIEDAKTYFSSHNARYDLIISEPSNPWVSGVASLFSEEFYRYIKSHLNEGGLLVQWVHLYEFNPTLVSSVLKALAPHFSDYVVFNTNSIDILIIASFAVYNEVELAKYAPQLIYVDTQNRIVRTAGHIPAQAAA